MLTSASAENPPLVASRFALGRRLGAGGLGEVWAARDRQSGAQVAIKILHAHLAGDGELCERFRREMAVTRGLGHPNIVRVFDLHQHGRRPCFSMELLQGRSLDALLIEEGPLPSQEARRIASGICAALQAVHRAGVVHRDLKPQNVFVTTDGAAKLLDFGLARVLAETPLTSKDAIPGTPGYLAPELLAGERADARADLYALGATLFEMLCGRRPFGSSNPYAAQREELRLDPRISDADGEILRRALEPDPEQRFLDASQMLRALSGEAVPRAHGVPPPIAAGEFDVLVHDVVRPLRLRKPPIARVLDRLGARARPQWRLRLLGAGQAVLVSGASRRTAEAAAAICAEQGLPATVRPVSLRPRSEELLARHGGWLLAALCALCGALATAALDSSAGWIALAATAGYMLSWGLRPPASSAPLVGRPGQESSLLRLADGVARRTERLQRLDASHPLLSAAAEAAGSARGSEAGDALTGRLLEIAVALDDALAIGAAA